MSKIIEDTFKKVSDNKYVVTYRQIAFAIMGGLGFAFIAWVFIDVVISDIKKYGYFNDIILSFFCIMVLFFLFAFVVMGLYATTTEIDLSQKKIRLMKKTVFGGGSIFETDIDKIGISALRMGITDASPNEVWIVRAGFVVVTQSGQSNDNAIWSKEVTSIEDRNRIMFELYSFFFPDRPPRTENDLITNGDIVMLLSDEQKKAFDDGTLFDLGPDNIQNANSSKFDNLLT